jgi:methionine-gamma-lyase
MRLETRAVRSARGHVRSDTTREVGGAHVPPIDLSTTYTFDTAEAVAASMDALIEGAGEAPNPVYARLQNPTVSRFESALADLESAEAGVAFASGMAAITAVVMAACSEASPEGWARGRHVVAVRPVYGGTDHLLTSGLLGTEVSWVESTEVASAVRHDTSLVLLETPANPTLVMVDIADVVSQVRACETRLGHRIAVAVDNTFATPILQRPLELGADLVVHSATKFLGGHGDVMGGVVATSEEWAHPLRQIRMITGGVLHPMAGYMLHRGLQTLPVRVRAQQASARVIAERLVLHPDVIAVHYPGLSGDPVETRLLQTQQVGPGSLLAFRVRGGREASERVMETLTLICRAVSLGSVDSLIQAPALLTHRVVDPASREAAGVPDDLLRLSVGLESVEDLWNDLEQALATVARIVPEPKSEAEAEAEAGPGLGEGAVMSAASPWESRAPSGEFEMVGGAGI